MNIAIRINNFKSIKTAELRLQQGLNILIGPNGAGKTCLLMALNFLRDLLVYGVARAVARAGGPRRTPRRGSKDFKLVVSMPYGQRTYRRRPKPMTLEWAIEIKLDTSEGIPLFANEQLEVKLEATGARLFLLQKRVSSTGKVQVRPELCDPAIFGRDLFSYWRQLKDVRKEELESSVIDFFRRFKQSNDTNPDRSIMGAASFLDLNIAKLSALLVNISEYNIVPELARKPIEPQPLPMMKPNGEGMADVLHALERGQFHRLDTVHRQMLMSFDEWPVPGRYMMRALGGFIYLGPSAHRKRRDAPNPLMQIKRELTAGVGTIDDFQTTIDPTTGRRYVQFGSGVERFFPDEVSDGTIKWLAILVSIFVPSAPIYLLEEPENFLHPWMQQRLISTMREQSRSSGTIFVLTTHSSTVLNAAEVEEVLIVRADSVEGTTVSAVPGRSDVEHALAHSHFGLGDLWVGGAIDGVPAP